MKKAFVILFALVLGCGAAGSAVEFTTVAEGDHAIGIADKINEVITDQASFDAFWKLVSVGTTPSPPYLRWTSRKTW